MTMTHEKRLMQAAVAVRAALLVWGPVQDANFEVPYTDVDYLVFTDAARFMARGESPYERDTYRYSPLIAAALVPNALVHPSWGKCLFAAGDLLAGWLIGRVSRLQGYGERDALASTAAWLFNPFTMTVSTRGSCESLVSTLMLTVVYFLLRGRAVPAAAVYGLATHLRIYPIVYALPLVLFLAERPVPLRSGERTAVRRRNEGGGGEGATLLSRLRKRLLTKETVTFAGVSAGVFLALGAACYAAYGDDFLREAFLFHLTRTDIRHNFSSTFYGAYLSEYAGGSKTMPSFGGGSSGGGIGGTGGVAGFASSGNGTNAMITSSYDAFAAAAGRKLLSALPQVSVVTAVGVKFARDPPFCLFLQTLAFVAFNKVCTAQYFVWYFCLMPLVLPAIGWSASGGLSSSSSSPRDADGGGDTRRVFGGGDGGGGGGDRGRGGGGGSEVVSHSRGLFRSTWVSCAAWLSAQLLWLCVAYSLEFRGLGVFLLLWGASLAFLGANAWVIIALTRAHSASSASKIRVE